MQWQNGGFKIDEETHNYSDGAPIYPGRMSVSGQSLNNSTNETDSHNVILPQESGSAGDESSGSIGTVQDVSTPAFNESELIAVPNLSYIWSITGIEPGQVIMVLKQEGEDLYGQAKYEPDSGQSWNGVVVG